MSLTQAAAVVIGLPLAVFVMFSFVRVLATEQQVQIGDAGDGAGLCARAARRLTGAGTPATPTSPSQRRRPSSCGLLYCSCVVLKI